MAHLLLTPATIRYVLTDALQSCDQGMLTMTLITLVEQGLSEKDAEQYATSVLASMSDPVRHFWASDSTTGACPEQL